MSTSARMIAVLGGLWMAGCAMAWPGQARALDQVVFGTDWKAQAEHGGFYHALINGIYREHGMAVTIRQGGPSIRHADLLAVGRVDFGLGSNSWENLNYVAAKRGIAAVAAIFQKDPQIVMAHPGQGFDTLQSLKGAPIMVSAGARVTFWPWLKRAHGFDDAQMRPYEWDMKTFLADPGVVTQAYLTSQPFLVERLWNGRKPVVHLLADHGNPSYAAIINASWKMIEERPDLVTRFVAASIKGWELYLSGGDEVAKRAADNLIMAENPDMNEAQIAFSVKAMKDYGLVRSGDALTIGIGAMTDSRWDAFLADSVASNLVPADLDLDRAYTLRFLPRS